ncbi:putative ribonuclease T2 [Medicago truncatula]|uniref:Putative ribonuclease T2 n=1 Tax=Medicago truncatula TaxID=3880 RepID=A2Q235_MEDTR|nr:hypothetical protein MtrDRAFT_AC149207g38v2 [Medicago truncatula]RHN72421.1 putative ribonuclease T2 [Medicago truncatula]
MDTKCFHEAKKLYTSSFETTYRSWFVAFKHSVASTPTFHICAICFQIYVGGTCDSFCQRPWEKHGICTPFSQYDYFCHTLYLWYIHNVTVMVDEKNIKPGTPMITNRSTQI